MKKETSKSSIWLKKELKPYFSRVILLSVLTTISIILSLSFAYLTRYIINSASSSNKDDLILFGIIIISVTIGRILVQVLTNFLSEKYRAKITLYLRNKLFNKILISSYKDVKSFHSGDLITRLTSDIQEVANDTISLLPSICGMIVQLIGAILALLILDPLFTVIFISIGLVISLVSFLLRKRIKKYQKELQEADSKSRSFMQEGILNVSTIKAYNASDRSLEKSKELLDTYYLKRMNRNYVRTSINACFSLIGSASMIFAIIWCSIKILNGSNDFGSILSVTLLVSQLQRPFVSFSSIFPIYYSRSASIERLMDIDSLDVEDDINNNEIDNLNTISLNDLSFSYNDNNEILSNVNLKIELNKIICIVGESGSGKSTLFKLLLDLYKPTNGSLTLNEEVINKSTRNNFAYVPQENFLLSGTIYENLTFFASKDLTNEEINKALEIACCDFIDTLPNKLDTKLNELGSGLSEGQLQRLSLARALLTNNPILLLDECTSALDEELEAKLLQNIASINKTCLIITHRPKALEIADTILKVEDKNIKVIK